MRHRKGQVQEDLLATILTWNQMNIYGSRNSGPFYALYVRV